MMTAIARAQISDPRSQQTQEAGPPTLSVLSPPASTELWLLSQSWLELARRLERHCVVEALSYSPTP